MDATHDVDAALDCEESPMVDLQRSCDDNRSNDENESACDSSAGIESDANDRQQSSMDVEVDEDVIDERRKNVRDDEMDVNDAGERQRNSVDVEVDENVIDEQRQDVQDVDDRTGANEGSITDQTNDINDFVFRWTKASTTIEQRPLAPRVPISATVTDTHIAPFNHVTRQPHFVMTTLERAARIDVEKPSNKGRAWKSTPKHVRDRSEEEADDIPSTNALEGTHQARGHSQPHSWYGVATSPMTFRLVPEAHRAFYASLGPYVPDDPHERERQCRIDSYTMSTIFPMQNRGFNDTIWAWHERWVRGLLLVFPYVHVITIPIFERRTDSLTGERYTTIRYLEGEWPMAKPDGYLRVIVTGPAAAMELDEGIADPPTLGVQNPLIDWVDGNITTQDALRTCKTVEPGTVASGAYYYRNESTSLRHDVTEFAVSWQWVREHTTIQMRDSWIRAKSLSTIVPYGPHKIDAPMEAGGYGNEQQRTDEAMARRLMLEHARLAIEIDGVSKRFFEVGQRLSMRKAQPSIGLFTAIKQRLDPRQYVPRRFAPSPIIFVIRATAQGLRIVANILDRKKALGPS